MIVLRNLSKSFRVDGEEFFVAKRLNTVFPTGRSVGLLGRNGAGKSTLLKIIAGTVRPTRGRVLSTGSISWPVGFAGSFHPELSGAQNTRFVARIYGVDTQELIAFVEDFANLGPHFHQPFRTYSAGMKSRLAFGVSMGVPFDTYLIDEVTSVGDAAFKKRSEEVLKERLRSSGAIVVSHGMGQIRALCDAGAVLHDGALTFFEDVEDAIAQHTANLNTTT